MSDIYFKKVRKALIAVDNTVHEVNNLSFVKTLNYSQDNLDKLMELLKNKDMQSINQIDVNNDQSEEYLFVMKFSDQHSNDFLVLVYENEDFWHFPQIKQIIRL